MTKAAEGDEANVTNSRLVGEVTQLRQSLDKMTEGLAEREAALERAVQRSARFKRRGVHTQARGETGAYTAGDGTGAASRRR